MNCRILSWSKLMKRIVCVFLLLLPVFAFSSPEEPRAIDFENPGLIDQTGTFSAAFLNEQNLKIKAFTEKTGILLRVIYTSTKDLTESTGALLRGIDDSRYAMLWICVRNDGAYYAVGESLFDTYDTKACTYIKAKTERAMRKDSPEKAIERCIDYSIGYGERSGIARFFYEYGIAVFLVLLLCFGISWGVVFRKKTGITGREKRSGRDK